SAIYRIFVQGWDKEEAIKEMTNGGFGFHSVWWNLVNYLKELEVEKIRVALLLERLNRWDEELLITY
ncbi:MAG: hypothetical protein ACYS5F_15040, partial [Planctomycetota bacterium]